MKMTTFKCY